MKKQKILTINLLFPFKLSKNSFRAALSFSLASLLDFFPLPFPFFPFFPFPFFFELCFSCVSSFTFFSFLSSLFFPPCLLFPSSTAESGLQQNRGKKDFDVHPALKQKSTSVWCKGMRRHDRPDGNTKCKQGEIKHPHSTMFVKNSQKYEDST